MDAARKPHYHRRTPIITTTGTTRFGGGKRFVVRAEEKLAASTELESALALASILLDEQVSFFETRHPLASEFEAKKPVPGSFFLGSELQSRGQTYRGKKGKTMNLLTHFKQIILPPLIVIVFGCFGLLPQAQAQGGGGCSNFTTKAGCEALKSNTTGTGDSAFGWRSLFLNTIGNFNTGLGAGALNLNDADSNTAVGAAALLLNTAGTQNTAVGTDALVFNDSGNFNTANGAFALFNSIAGSQNTAIGNSALTLNTGDNNTAVGSSALASNTTGSGNIALGVLAGSAVTDASSVIAIGADGDNVSNTTWIGNVYAVATQSGTTAPVIVSDTGQLGTVVSSERFKKDIATMDKSSETVLSLRPVTFRYKTDAKGTPQFGLIAEEVAKVNPALVLPDKEGKPYTVRYDAVNAMLLNEFLKEHRAVQDLKATVAEQQKQIEALTAGLQKVSTQLELSKSAPKTVLNDQ